uniref:Uncharacterized protein n=1 Tax=Anguilla anguilla TaxID=7936 RepID=A0A0E9SXD8_ANGAN
MIHEYAIFIIMATCSLFSLL